MNRVRTGLCIEGVVGIVLLVISALPHPVALGAAGSTLPPGPCLDISDVPLDTQFLDGSGSEMTGMASGSAVSFNAEPSHGSLIMYQATYCPGEWTGDVSAYSVDEATGNVVKDMPLWSAAELLDARNWNSGRVIATFDGVEGVPFRFSDLTEEQKSDLDPDWRVDDAVAVDRLEYLRGNTVKEIANGGPLRNRPSLMGDIVHSSPVYLEGVLYVGGNDGMLHALNASDGEEMFAYVPNLVFQNLRDLTSPSYEHHYFVDLSPTARDTGHGTYLVGGLGRGGKGVYCLDVSDPFTVYSEVDLAGKVMWEYPCLSTPGTETLDIGYSYSFPSIVNSNEGWVVIFGNGYCSPDENAVLFVLDLSTGACIARIDTGVGGCNGLSSPVVVDTNNDARVDYVYAGDLGGNLWKFDLTGAEASEWDVAYHHGTKPKPLFQARDETGGSQPITTRPDVMDHCSRTMPGYIVVFGTGKYLGNTDLTDSSTQTVYGIWDYGDDDDDSEYLGAFQRGAARQLSNQPETVGLLEQVEVYQGTANGRGLRVLSDYEPDWVVVPDEDAGQEPDPSCSVRNHAGWFFDLPLPKERVVRDPGIREGKAVVVSSVLKRSSDAAEGHSVVHEINACTGGRIGTPQFDITGGDGIDEQDMIAVPDPGHPGEPDRAAPTGVVFPSMVSSPRILRRPGGAEIMYFNSADGNRISLKGLGEDEGFYYWRYLD
jgi:type IV pilus assembly protein PilY1